MINSSSLLTDLKVQLRGLQADLKGRADDATTTWGATLQHEHAEALRRERTGLSWTAWRDNEVDQAAVAWIVATTFIRFCEDNDLLIGATLDGMPVPVGWIAGPGDRTARTRENQTAYFRLNTSHHDRDWLQQAFRVLAAQPAGVALVDPKHNPVWTAEISAEAATALVNFWRRTDDDGALVHDFTDPDLDTRFLGDLYQDLSDHAKKTYALLQTPVFVEQFILDRTLTPAIAEFGIDGLKLIDPTCGSGHFLLGAFERLNHQWATQAPGMDAKQRVRKAMDSIHGVDLNPFAVAISRFRLTVAGLQTAGEKSLVGVTPMGFHLAVGDSLLGAHGKQGELEVDLIGDASTLPEAALGEPNYNYVTEDVNEYGEILEHGRYHVVVGNPPYITVADPVLNKVYRKIYRTCFRKYQLTAPFAELFFRLAIRGANRSPAGHVGQITSNAFMTREFGRKLIEDFFAGKDPELAFSNPVELTHVIDSSGAWMAGHNFDGTPTVILIGRRRRPSGAPVRAVLGVKGDSGQPANPAEGPVWTEIMGRVDQPGFDGAYVSVSDLDREVLSTYPWSLSGGGADQLKLRIEGASARKLGNVVEPIGFSVITGDDEFLTSPRHVAQRIGFDAATTYVVGDEVRDWTVANSEVSLVPTALDGTPLEPSTSHAHFLWRGRTGLADRRYFGETPSQRGKRWFDYAIDFPARNAAPSKIVFAFVATHNHFVLDGGGRVFKQSAPVITLRRGASKQDHLDLLAVLNSSTACFWLKEVSYAKDNNAERWATRYEFTGTKLQEFPLPADLPGERGAVLEELAQWFDAESPQKVVGKWRLGLTDGGLAPTLQAAHVRWAGLRERLIFEQEELDWEVYWIFGLVDEDVIYRGDTIDRISLGSRAFEIALARRVEAGDEGIAWFERHGSNPVLDLPAEWPNDYRVLVERRLSLMESDGGIRLLEKPEYKRRWTTVPWEKQLQGALEAAMLDRLEDVDLWRDLQGPAPRSVAQLADLLRNDEVLVELAQVLTGNGEPDLAAVIASLTTAEAVPYLAAFRYKPSGLEKFREWQVVWELQRREDAGERVAIPVPRNYTTPDFAKIEYWKVRGKLDVPKERFILYLGVGREGDSSMVLGWAGWNHRDQAIAIVREIMNQQALGASNEAVVPMVAGLVELEPWLHQWHTDLEPEFGSSAAQAVTSQIDQFLAQLQMTRDDVNAWRPPAATRGRRRRT